MKGYSLILLLALCPFCLSSQEKKDTLRFRVMSYNVENLFDYRHDTLKEDYDFLPDAVRHWDKYKYRKKLDDVARVIIATGGWMAPALVGLCEVENDSVLLDLIHYSALREAGYRYIMTQSNDIRGIDVALLYQRHLFKPIYNQSIRITPPNKYEKATRDILHVSGILLNRDTLDVFIAHFPSRSGGRKQTESYRMQAARRLKTTIDSIMQLRERPQILIMGDLNAPPTNRSIQEGLKAHLTTSTIVPHRLYQLLAQKTKKKDFGSYKYQGIWELIDHIIVSGSLLQKDAPLSTSEENADIGLWPFLLNDDKRYGGNQPFRTYQGMKYQGGYSDHLPIWAEFQLLY
ncbi:MAG: endonuclease [Mediterranea massiliensis]|nr:endonuclease [Mediterranea massiliensis]